MTTPIQVDAPAEDTCEHTARPGYHDDKAKVLARLRRVEGQVRGLQRMVDEDTYCIDVLTQVSAANRALQQVALLLLDDHVRHCVADDVRDGSEAKIDEAMDAIARFVRT
jgi:DNA-binding FrmR family transcriptional regulator